MPKHQDQAGPANPSQGPRFSTEELRCSFQTREFHLIGSRFLDMSFYTTYYPDVVEISTTMHFLN